MGIDGKRLRELREAKGVHPSEIAKYLGITRPAYLKYENGETKNPRQLDKLADYFSVSVDYLLGTSPFKNPELLGKLDRNHPMAKYIMPKNDEEWEQAVENMRFSASLQKDEQGKALWNAIKNFFTGEEESKEPPIQELPYSKGTKKIPVIASVKCGPNGYAFEETDGHVMIDDSYKGNIKAFRCRGDSMDGIGIYEGDIAIVRMQEDVEDGALAVVVINGEEGALKRVRKHEDVLILESYNAAYPPRIFAGKEMNDVKIVGKVMETRRLY